MCVTKRNVFLKHPGLESLDDSKPEVGKCQKWCHRCVGGHFEGPVLGGRK